MIKILNSIVKIGVSEDLPFNLQNKIRVFNGANIVLSLICLFYSAFGLYQQRYVTVFVTGSEFLLLVFGFYLIHSKKYNHAFHFGLLSGIVFILVYSFLFGEKSQTHIFLFFLPIAAIILFDKQKIIVSYFVLCALFLACAKLIFSLFKPYYDYNSIIDTIGWLNCIFLVLLIFLGVKQFKLENVNFIAQINKQRFELKEKNKDITDSIQYAKRIQKALMASDYLLNQHLHEYFVLYLPKDIVSGDFYWAEKSEGRFLLGVCDCTGHGVPGAFMSLLNISKLNETILGKNIVQPNLILNQVRDEIIKALNPLGTKEDGRDGMDAVVCSFDFKNLKLDYAAANNPLWVYRNGEIIEGKYDKMPVGMHNGKINDFELQSMDLHKGDCIYMFTDGYADQFGGEKGKKFKYAQLKETLSAIHQLPMAEQQQRLQSTFESWKGNLEQVDDVLLVGIRV